MELAAAPANVAIARTHPERVSMIGTVYRALFTLGVEPSKV
jgi:hypothetical protein